MDSPLPRASSEQNITDLHLGDDAAIDAYFAPQLGEGRDGLSWATAYQIKNLCFNNSAEGIAAINITGSRFIEIKNCSFISDFPLAFFNPAIFVRNFALLLENCSFSKFNMACYYWDLAELIVRDVDAIGVQWGISGSVDRKSVV